MPPADLAHALSAGDAESSWRTFDAIVVGAGAAGGLAASLLCESGVDVLLLDAGHRPPAWRQPLRRLTHAVVSSAADPRLLKVLSPRFIGRGRTALRLVGRIRQPVQTQCFAWERMPGAFVDDRDFPYETPSQRPFTWIRTHGIGGRMIVPGHGRQYYRLGASELTSPDEDCPSWPLEGGELDPWYGLVEQRLALAGAYDGLDTPPDSEITRVLAPTADEARAIETIRARFPRAAIILSRYAAPLDSVEAAAATGRLWCRTGAVAQALTTTAHGAVNGVDWYDLRSQTRRSARAPLVFLCASTLESTRILLQSESLEGNRGVLGHYLMDHMLMKAEGIGGRLASDVEVEPGRCLYLPRFDLRNGEAGAAAKRDRGFGIQLYRTPAGERSWFTAVAFGEVASRIENAVTLNPTCRDKWGNPALSVSYEFGDAEYRLAAKMATALKELAEVMGAKLHRLDRLPATPGSSVHECGTARMGADPANSVLNSNNECWAAPGLYVTDGACFPRQGAQNPTLTIMALTARACRHAIR